MYSFDDMSGLNQDQLNSLIDDLKRENNCLETGLNKSELLVESSEKCMDFCEQINETIASNEEILVLNERIDVLKSVKNNSCIVLIKESKDLKESDVNWNQFSAINQLKRRNNCLKNDSLNCNLLLKSYQKCLDSYERNDETIAGNEEIIALKLSFVSMNESNDNCLKESDVRKDCDESQQTIETSETDDNEVVSISTSLEKVSIKNNGNNGFVCNFKGCSAVLRTAQRLEYHTNKHFGRFKCDVKGCTYRTGNPFYLPQHKKNKHLKTKNKSKESDVRRYRGKGLQTTETDGNEEMVPIKSFEKFSIKSSGFVCNFKDCSSIIRTSAGLLYHQNKHSGKFKCDVEGCTYRAGYRLYLLQHKRNKHSKTWNKSKPISKQKKASKCLMKKDCYVDGCPFSTSFDSILKRHMSDKHSNETRIECLIEKCEKQFKSVDKLKNHLRSVHNIYEFPFKEDNKDIKPKPKTNRPLNIEIPEMDDISSTVYVCPLESCGKLFQTKDLLLKHKTHIHNICENSTNGSKPQIQRRSDDNNEDMTKENVKKLMANNSSDITESGSVSKIGKRSARPMKTQFRCDECKAILKSSDYLKRHMIKHTNRFLCGIDGCDFKGRDNFELNHHTIHKHSDERPFECSEEDCSLSFKTHSNLNRHLKTVHKLIET